MEATGGFGPPIGVLQTPALTTWPRRPGAEDEIRTRDLLLGKEMCYHCTTSAGSPGADERTRTSTGVGSQQPLKLPRLPNSATPARLEPPRKYTGSLKPCQSSAAARRHRRKRVDRGSVRPY